MLEKYDLQFNQNTGQDFGIILYDYPEIEQAKHNYNTYSIPGRDGELVSSDDHLSNITVKCTFSVLSKRLIPKIREIKQWLSGTGKLKFTDTADVFYEVLKVECDSIERELRNYGKFSVIFTCYPYEFAIEGQYPRKIEEIRHNGYDKCMPLYEIWGDGQCVLTVNGKSMGATVYGNLIIDSRLMLAYMAGNVLMNTSVTGKYEDLWLPHGDCSISITDGFVLKVTPRWGWKA